MPSLLDITLDLGDKLGGFSKEAHRLAEPEEKTRKLLSRVQGAPVPLDRLTQDMVEQDIDPETLHDALEQELVEVSDGRVSITPLGASQLESIVVDA